MRIRGRAVFGYIRVQKSELKLREYDAYKSVYCGLCRQLGRDYSFLSRFLLSYDCTFYAMFIMSLGRSCSGFETGRCRFNPMKKCSYCKCESDCMSKAAAVNVTLAYYKLIDDISDSGFFKRALCRAVKPFLSRWRKKANARYPEIDSLAAGMMRSQQEAEKSPDCGIDMAAHPTASFLSSLLSAEAQSEAQKRIYSQIGYGLGRFIYLADAADDLEKDIKSGNFNPFNSEKENNRDVIGNNLSQALAMTFDAYNLLDLTDFRGIIDNVILLGLPSVQKEITGTEVKDERSV